MKKGANAIVEYILVLGMFIAIVGAFCKLRHIRSADILLWIGVIATIIVISIRYFSQQNIVSNVKTAAMIVALLAIFARIEHIYDPVVLLRVTMIAGITYSCITVYEIISKK